MIRANSISETVTQTIHMIMWFIGGLLVTSFTSTTILWSVAVLFIVSTFLLSLLDLIEQENKDEIKMSEQFLEGWKTIAHDPALRKIAKIMFLESIADTVWVAAILLVFVEQALGTDESWWGLINGAFFVGVIVGSIYCVKYSSYIERNLTTFFYMSTFVSFGLTIIFSMTSIPLLAVFLSVIIGIAGQLESIPQQTIIQRTVPAKRLATVYSSLGTIVTGIFGVSVLIMGTIAEYFGVRYVYLIAGALLLIVSIIAFRGRHEFITNTSKVEV
ncbi:MFS transporter [Bacillus sp. AK128]